MKYYIDGFTNGANPAKEGGYTITDENGSILKHEFVKSENDARAITNNYVEFLALRDCLMGFCKEGDVILTDSTNNLSWANLRFTRNSKRKDLIPLAIEVHSLLFKLNVKLEWIPREKNYAGFANEIVKKKELNELTS